MARKRKLDRLDIEAKKATDAGMSYGKWKALQPPDKPAPPPKPKYMTECKCKWCGKTFYQTDKRRRKYCSPECVNDSRMDSISKFQKAHPEKYKEYKRRWIAKQELISNAEEERSTRIS